MMGKFDRHSGVAAPMPITSVDTHMITPWQFLTATKSNWPQNASGD